MTLWRFSFFATGIFILTFGIASMIRSGLGTSPFDALLVGLHRNFGLTVGSWEIVLGGSFVLFNAVAQRRRPEYLALLTALITGIGIDFWLIVTSFWMHPETIVSQYFLLLIGLAASGLGVAVNLQADFAPNPMDRSMLVVRDLTGMNVFLSRGLISIILVILAFLLSGPIGIGTVLSAIFSGAVIFYFMPYVNVLYRKHSTQGISN